MILDLQWFHFKKWKIPTIRKNVRFPLLAKEHLMILDLLSLMILGLMILVKKLLDVFSLDCWIFVCWSL